MQKRNGKLLDRLSVNYFCAPPECSIEQFCTLLSARGIGGIGLTDRAVLALPANRLVRLLDNHDLAVSSLNSAGYFLHADPTRTRQQEELTDRLFEVAVLVDAPINIIAGGLLHGEVTIERARTIVVARLEELAKRAVSAQVRLAIEPIHPMAIGTLGCINQLRHAGQIAKGHANLGITVDVAHSWWDMDLESFICTEVEKLLVVQICDIAFAADGNRPPKRVQLGDGILDLPRFLNTVKIAGFRGAIEYEVFHDQLPDVSVEAVIDRGATVFLDLMKESGDTPWPDVRGAP